MTGAERRHADDLEAERAIGQVPCDSMAGASRRDAHLHPRQARQRRHAGSRRGHGQAERAVGLGRERALAERRRADREVEEHRAPGAIGPDCEARAGLARGRECLRPTPAPLVTDAEIEPPAGAPGIEAKRLFVGRDGLGVTLRAEQPQRRAEVDEQIACALGIAPRFGAERVDARSRSARREHCRPFDEWRLVGGAQLGRCDERGRRSGHELRVFGVPREHDTHLALELRVRRRATERLEPQPIERAIGAEQWAQDGERCERRRPVSRGERGLSRLEGVRRELLRVRAHEARR